MIHLEAYLSWHVWLYILYVLPWKRRNHTSLIKRSMRNSWNGLQKKRWKDLLSISDIKDGYKSTVKNRGFLLYGGNWRTSRHLRCRTPTGTLTASMWHLGKTTSTAWPWLQDECQSPQETARNSWFCSGNHKPSSPLSSPLRPAAWRYTL